MDLIIGGAFQGKLEYAKKRFGLSDEDIFFCEESVIINTKARCVCGLERYVLACVKEGAVPRSDFNEDAVLIGRDISSGVVPADPLTRRYREAYGRYMQELGGKAKSVTRLFCGIPQKLK